MKTRALFLTIGLTAALSGVSVYAQDAASSQDPGPVDQAATNSSDQTQSAPGPAAPPPQTAPLINASWQKALTQEFSRAGNLLGKEAQPGLSTGCPAE